MNVMLFGMSGPVGKNVLKLLLRLDEVERVVCPVFHGDEIGVLDALDKRSKIELEEIDFGQALSEDAACRVTFCGRMGTLMDKMDAVFFCVETMRKQALTRICRERMEVKLPLVIAAIAKGKSVRHFLCESVQGAGRYSPFFHKRLKGELEDGLTLMNFECLTLARPSFLLCSHENDGLFESFLFKTIGKHPELMPARVRPVFPEAVAAHLVASLLSPPIESVCASDGARGKRIIYNRIIATADSSKLF